MSRDTRFPSTRRDLPIFHLRGLLRDASMPPRQQSFSLKSFLVRDFSCPSCDNSPSPLSFIYTLLLFNSLFPFSSRVTLLFRPRVITNVSNASSLSQRWRIIRSRFSFAHFNFSLGPFSNFDSRKPSSLSQFIVPRDRSKNRQINSLPINRLLSNDQLSPVLLFLSPYSSSTPLSSSNEAETLEPVLPHSHPSIRPFIPRIGG